MDDHTSPRPPQRMRETSTGRPVVDVGAGANVGAAPSTTVRIPPPRKRARFSKRLAWRLFTRVLMAGALIALALLVAAPERHQVCPQCDWTYLRANGLTRMLGPRSRATVPRLGGTVVINGAAFSPPLNQAFLFASGSGNCKCARHAELGEWFTIARESIWPSPTPPPTPPGPALGGGAKVNWRRTR